MSWRNELVTRTEKGEDGEPVMVLMPRVTIVDADKISDEAAAAVAEVSQTVNGALRVKMHDKHAALVSLGRHLGLFTDIVQMKAVYGVSDKPMSAEEWKKQYVRERRGTGSRFSNQPRRPFGLHSQRPFFATPKPSCKFESLSVLIWHTVCFITDSGATPGVGG
jgi:hypothetical protein